MLTRPDPLRLLAQALRPALGLASDTARAPLVDMAMVEFARRRHRIAPLLSASLEHPAGRAESARIAASLALLRAANARRCETLERAERGAGTALEQAGVAWRPIKGLALARALYGEAGLRCHRDSDILITPRDMPRAARALARAGFRWKPDQFAGAGAGILRPLRQRMAARAAKDVSFLDPGGEALIELHQRLLAVEPPGFTAPLLPHSGEGKALEPTDPLYALYLVLHGALSYWHRLKWLADLVLLLRALGAEGGDRLAREAQGHDALPAVRASVRLCGELFPGSDAGAGDAILAHADDEAREEALLNRFRARLASSAPGDPAEPAPIPMFENPPLLVFGRAISPVRMWQQRALNSLMLRL